MYLKVTCVWCLVALSLVRAKSLLKAASCLDCHTLQLNPSLHGANRSLVDCSKTNLPYCDDTTASCSATPTPSCEPPDNFTCLSDGYFPDPWDCRTFHLCVDGSSTRYQCDSTVPSSYKYDVVLHRCSQSSVCGFYCAGKSGIKVPHPADRNLFVYCYNGTAFLQDRCPANYELQETSQRCEPVCKIQGLMVDLEDCRKFFRCIRQYAGYWRKHEECPVGQGFDVLSFRCQEGYCKNSTETTTHEPTKSHKQQSQLYTKLSGRTTNY